MLTNRMEVTQLVAMEPGTQPPQAASRSVLLSIDFRLQIPS